MALFDKLVEKAKAQKAFKGRTRTAKGILGTFPLGGGRKGGLASKLARRFVRRKDKGAVEAVRPGIAPRRDKLGTVK